MLVNRWLAIRIDFLGALIVLFSSMCMVYMRGQLTGGMAGLIITNALNVTASLVWFIRTLCDMERNSVAVERISQYIRLPVEDVKDPNDDDDDDWPREGRVELRNYDLRYREGLDLALKGINLDVKKGEKLAICGRTGAGKSSLTLGLFRLIEAAGGQILIDGIDIKTLALQTLRSRITIIPQDPVIFTGSVRFNLDPTGSIDDEFLWRALNKVNLSSVIQGLDSQVAEKGENFSAGQRQLLCLARALLRRSKILVLDEATASVDVETDSQMQKVIREEFNECTLVTIAHRLNTILDNDRVAVLQDGRVEELGAPAELLRIKESLFYGLAKSAGIST